MKQHLRNLLTILALLYLVPVHAQKISLVYDINTKNTDYSINPHDFVSLNNKLYFSAYDRIYGNELWVYDSINKPQALADICPGNLESSLKSLIVYNNKLYFEYMDRLYNKQELWEYDGVNNFKIIKQLAPQVLTFDPFYNTSEKKVYNNKLFFYVWDNARSGVYCYDGDTVKLITLGDWSYCSTIFKNKLYIAMGSKLIVYNDTLPPSTVYKNESKQTFYADHLIVYKEKLYFSSVDSEHGFEFWEFDGINYPKLVADIWPGPSRSDPCEFTICNNKLYFQATDAEHGCELWVYDGSAPPTLVADISLGTNSSEPSYLTAYNNKLFFSANDGIIGNELWVYDGINAPSAVADIVPGSSWSQPTSLYVFNNQLFFNALSKKTINGLYCKDIWCYDDNKSPHLTCYKQNDTDDSNLRFIKTFNDKLYFFADTNSKATGDMLWSYNGISKPTIIKSFSGKASTINHDNFIECNNKLYFAANNNDSGEELWIYDGLNNFEQKDLYPGVNSGFSFYGPGFTIYNGKVYFIATLGATSKNIYSISQSGSVNLAYPSNSGVGSSMTSLTVFRNKLYFWSNDDTGGYCMWACDGINPPSKVLGSKMIDVCNSLVFKDKLYFTNKTSYAIDGYNLYAYDGVNPPYIVANVKYRIAKNNYVIFKDKLYFCNGDDNYGNELWVYDGVNPCYMLADINQGSESSNPGYFYVFNNKLYFTANDGVHGYELWSYDGNTPPVLAADIYPGSTGSSPAYFCGYKNKLYFQARGESTGIELFSFCECTYSSITASSCNQYIAPSGKVIANTGIYYDTIPNKNGCDSIITINLTLLRTFSTLNPKVCKSYVSPSGKYIWTKSGSYTDTLVNVAGCDSIIAVNLQILNNSSSIINPVACNSYLSPSGKYQWTSSGAYTDTLVNAAGCDSIIAVNLQILNSSSSTINPVACNSYLSPSGKYQWTASGAYTDTLVNAAGCDSIIAVNLKVLNSSSSIINPVACNSYLSPSGKHRWTSSGAYTDTLVNATGCDSIIAVNLKVLNSSSSIINPVACNSYLSPSGKHRWTHSGAYTDTLVNATGCDSIIAVNLKVLNSSSSIINPVACNSYLSPSGKHRWTHSGAYTDTLVNATGCDSIIAVNLKVLNSSSSIINPVACNSYLSPSGKYRWTSNGAYTDTIVNAAGCDSIIYITLKVVVPDISVSNFPDSLVANAMDANYQWLNCNNGNLPIDGATNRTFKSREDGYYAVEINQNNCKDTSLCYSISGYLSIDNTIPSSIHIYPNPTNKNVNIELDHFCKKLHVRLINNMGSIVKSYFYEMTDKITLDINGIKGMFYLELHLDEEKSKLFKIVIE